MPIPPLGVRFRIISVKENKMLSGQAGTAGFLPPLHSAVDAAAIHTARWMFSKKPLYPLAQVPSDTGNYKYDDDSWFVLQSSDVKDYYRIRHVTSERWLFGMADGIYSFYLMWTTTPDETDQLWKLDCNHEGEIQLWNHDVGRLGWTEIHPHGIIPRVQFREHAIYPDHYVRFCIEEYRIKNIIFDFDKGGILSKTPKLLASQVFKNITSVEQSQMFRTKYTKSKKHRFEYKSGFKIEVGMDVGFKTGIPMFSEGDNRLRLGLETEHHWTTETVTTESEEMTFEFPLIVPAGKSLTASIKIMEETAEVPYTMTLQFKASQLEVKSHGNWQGVQSVVVTTEISEDK